MAILVIVVLIGSIELRHLCDHLCNQKMFDVLWMMEEQLNGRGKKEEYLDVRCKRRMKEDVFTKSEG